MLQLCSFCHTISLQKILKSWCVAFGEVCTKHLKNICNVISGHLWSPTIPHYQSSFSVSQNLDIPKSGSATSKIPSLGLSRQHFCYMSIVAKRNHDLSIFSIDIMPISIEICVSLSPQARLLLEPDLCSWLQKGSLLFHKKWTPSVGTTIVMSERKTTSAFNGKTKYF